MNNKKIGNIGENRAQNYLKIKGHRIIETNFKTQYGEIDIISIYDKSIYVYEVKYRKNLNFGFGDDAISQQKINKICKAFDIWLSKNSEFYEFDNVYFNALVIDPDGKINEYEVM